MSTTLSATLDRIPDEIVRAVSKRTIIPYDGSACIVGWAVREAKARTGWWNRLWRRDAADVWTSDPVVEGVSLFGGTAKEWVGVYCGILSDRATVMAAWDRRVTQAFARAG